MTSSLEFRNAKKVFSIDSDDIVITDRKNPWSIEGDIYINYDDWQIILCVARQISELFGDELDESTEKFEGYSIDSACLLMKSLLKIRNHLKFYEFFEECSENLEYPLVSFEYVRMIDLIISFTQKCIEKGKTYSIWTE